MMNQTRCVVVYVVYEVLGKPPRHGVGSRIQRTSWYENSFWDIAKVNIDVSGNTAVDGSAGVPIIPLKNL